MQRNNSYSSYNQTILFSPSMNNTLNRMKNNYKHYKTLNIVKEVIFFDTSNHNCIDNNSYMFIFL